MKRFYLLKLVMLIAILSGWDLNAFAQTTTYTFNGTPGGGNSGINGTPQTYVVPPGVTQIGIDMYGGCGGYACCTTLPVANGGRVQCTMNVTPSSTLYVYVGGAGGSSFDVVNNVPGGWNGGGTGGAPTSAFCASGGGASDIRTSTTGPYATSVLVVAGAGGGGGDFGPMGGLGGGVTGGAGGIDPTGSAPGGPAACGGGQTGPSCTGGYNLGTQGQGASTLLYSQGGGGGGWWGGNGGLGDNGGGGGSSYPASPNGTVTAIVHTQGYSLATGNGKVTITVLCANTGSIVGSSTVCTGAATTLTNPTGSAGGTWTTSNPAVATVNPSTGVVTGINPGTTTITYVVSNPCLGLPFATSVITVNQSPTTTGSPSICTNQTTAFTGSITPGIWSSSNTSTANVSPTGGVTGVAVGTATIVYTLPTGCFANYPVTVNLSPNSNTVTGGGGYCSGVPGAGVAIGLNGSSTGISYALYSGSSPVATLPGTGSPLSYGIFTATGSYTVVATRAIGGCSLTMAGAANVFLNPNPSAITGPANVCVGSSIVLGSTPAGGTWSSSNIAFGTVNPSAGVVSGVAGGNITVTYTLTGGCNVRTPILINPVPVAISGITNVCAGSTTILNTVTSGGTWSSSNTALATVPTAAGVVSGVSAGTANISYTLSTGCYTTTPVAVNLLPVSYPVTGGGPYCAGAGVHIGLSYANSGISYQLFNGSFPVGAPMSGSNAGLDFGLVMDPGTYTVSGTNSGTGCGQAMSGSTVVTINPLPNTTFMVGGGGNYCTGGTGSHISLSGSEAGTSYQLINGTPIGSAVPGTGAGVLDLGLQTTTGTYTVLATTAMGCTGMMTGSANIAVNSLPTPYTLGGGGSFCQGGPGADIILEGSDPGTNYQLFRGPTSVTTITGTGGPIDFGFMPTGTYTVAADNPATSCNATMAGSPTVSASALPIAYTVTGGGNFCAGGVGVHVGLSYSDPGFTYQLYIGSSMVGFPIAGSSSGLDFGFITTPGVYTIVATNIVTGCTSNMTGSAGVTISSALTPFTVTGGGAYCNGGSGDHIGLAGSTPGIFYQLYNGITAIGSPVTGSGAAVNFGLHTAGGTYTVIATSPTTGCTNTMPGVATVTPVALPTVYNTITAGSNSFYCAGGAGVDLLLDGSDIGTNYQLFRGMIPVGVVKAGTGSALDFGLNTTVGTYTIVAITSSTGCNNNMASSVNVTIAPLPNIYSITGGGNYCVGAAGVHVGLSGSNPGISYQLLNGGIPVAGANLSGTGVALDFGYQTAAGSYTVSAINNLTFCTANMAGAVAVIPNSLPNPYSTTGDGGSYCASATGSSVGLSGSASGVKYQLYNGTSTVGSPVTGTGSVLDLGLHGAGTYSVLATNTTTGCSSTMPGTASIAVNALPSVYPVTGTGNICSAGAGANVGLGNSDLGTNYQIYLGGIATGGSVAGTGSAVTLGVETAGGTYTVVATDGTTACTNNMMGSAVVTVVTSPAANNVIGGGGYCAGATGRNIGLDGTTRGISYQLYNGSAAVGGPVTGTGSAIDFGPQASAGSYTVIASPGGACQTSMLGAATISINPLPAVFTVTGGGNYCAGSLIPGSDIGLSGSATGVKYQLYNGTSTAGSFLNGTGSPLDFGLQALPGSYSVVATDFGTGCTNNMTSTGSILVNISPLPHIYNVMGGGNYCTGGAGEHIELSGSHTNINYQLYNGPALAGSPMAGSGTELDFGALTAAGNYWIKATDAFTLCTSNMADTATIAIESYLTPVVSITANPGFTLNPGQLVEFTANVTNGGTPPLYQWYIDNLPVTGATDMTFTASNFANNDSVRCVVTSSGLCGGVSTAKAARITVVNVGVQQVSAFGSDVSLLPNPNKGAFTLKGSLGTTSDEEVSLEITDMVGHVVYTQKVTAKGGTINENIRVANNLANGMYILSLRSATEDKVFHMVIEQ